MKNTEIVSTTRIHTLNFELSSFFAERQIWVNGVLFTREKPRPASALVFLSGCTGVYTDLKTGEEFFAPCKSLVYLPYGSRYSVLNLDSKLYKPDAYLVEFNMLLDDICIALSPKPFIIDNLNQFYIEKTMREIVDCYETAPLSYPLLKSKIYSILARLSSEKSTYNDKIYETISPALEHMDQSPYDSVSIEEYAKMCGLSCGGFRRLFKQYMGKSPRRHIIDNKISAAKRLLEESNLSVREISEILGFENTSYFCRLFKERVEVTPSEFREKIKVKTIGI